MTTAYHITPIHISDSLGVTEHAHTDDTLYACITEDYMQHLIPHETTYVIVDRQELDDLTGEPLFWSNEDGWGSFQTSTLFDEAEVERLRLPIGHQVEWLPFWDGVAISQSRH